MKRIFVICLEMSPGMVAILVGLGFLAPSLSKLRDYEALPTVGLLFTGLLLILAGTAGIACVVTRSTRATNLPANSDSTALE